MTQNTPHKSIHIQCPHCQQTTTRESGGSYTRKHRDLQEVRIIRIQRYRCSHCQHALPSQLPKGVHRHKWYTSLIQALFAILGVHQVKQACKTEIAALFNYPLVPDTQNNWQDTRAFRAEQQHEIEVKQLKQDKVEIKCGSVDEFKLGSDWAYTLTDTSSQAVVSYQQSSTREETAVRDVISVIPPKAIISDGCLAIQAGAAWWSDIAQRPRP